MRLLALFSVFMVLGVGTATQQSSPGLSEREQDTYAVYSVLMSRPPTSWGNDPNEMYAIAAETRVIRRGTFDLVSCIQLSAEYDARWKEILSEIDSGSDSPTTLQRSLKIGKPYTFLAGDELKRFEDSVRSRGIQAPVAGDTPLKGAVDIFFLSNVYFDKTRTLALVQLTSVCGMLCGEVDSKVYEKGTNGAWLEVRPLRFCAVYF